MPLVAGYKPCMTLRPFADVVEHIDVRTGISQERREG